MPATVSVLEAKALAYAAQISHVQFHTADPTPAGTVAVSGARVPLTWTPGSEDGQIVGVASYDVPDGVKITHASLWGALTAGVLKDYGVLTQPYTGPGAYALTVQRTELS